MWNEKQNQEKKNVQVCTPEYLNKLCEWLRETVYSRRGLARIFYIIFAGKEDSLKKYRRWSGMHTLGSPSCTYI